MPAAADDMVDAPGVAKGAVAGHDVVWHHLVLPEPLGAPLAGSLRQLEAVASHVGKGKAVVQAPERPKLSRFLDGCAIEQANMAVMQIRIQANLPEHSLAQRLEEVLAFPDALEQRHIAEIPRLDSLAVTTVSRRDMPHAK